MTKAEKVRAYDEAIKRAKEINNEQKAQLFDVMLKIFPELKESEDERIRKDILVFIRHEGQHIDKYEWHKWIAWLEKQGEREEPQVYKTKDGEIITYSESDGYKVIKSKFHEDDWITNGDYTWKIVEVKPLDYILQSQDGNIVDDTISHVDEQFHSFTIEDAKDGDVLVIQKTNVSYESIFIFNKIENNRIIQYLHYFTTDADEEVFEARTADGFLGFVGTTVHPATKEQRDTLLKAMVDAGYKWDSENKILLSLKAEPNSEQKIARWSEEDERKYEDIRGCIYHCCVLTEAKHLCNWLETHLSK